MPENEPTLKVNGFQGLNNVADQAALDISWLVTADNVVLDDAGKVRRRPGYTSFLSGYDAIYATRDGQAMLGIKSGTLYELLADGSEWALISVGDGPYYIDEGAGTVFLHAPNGTSRILAPGDVKQWNRARPAPAYLVPGSGSLPAGTYRVVLSTKYGDEDGPGSDASSIELAADSSLEISVGSAPVDVWIATPGSTLAHKAYSQVSDTVVWNGATLGAPFQHEGLLGIPPGTTQIAWHRAQIWCAVYQPQYGATYCFRSKPFEYTRFDYVHDFVGVPGKVTLMGSTPDGLVIGTDKEIYGWVPSQDNVPYLRKLADYGAVEGSLVYRDDAKVTFWTARGACNALPLQNISEDRLSVAPGTFAGAGLIKRDGVEQYAVSPNSEGTAHNPWIRPDAPTFFHNGL